MKIKLTSLLIVLTLIILSVTGCKQQITKEEAEIAAMNYVNQVVRFTTTDNSTNTKTIVTHAKNTITNSYLQDSNWNVDILTESIINNETKRASFTVVVDPSNGEVKNIIPRQNP
jgi:hypothetical protein